jgi:hypothetical protein
MDLAVLRSALLLVFALVGGMAMERWLIHYGVRWYLRAGLPLIEQLVPIPSMPKGQGRTASVIWKVVDGQFVHFWADPALGGAATGLHGAVRCVSVRGRVQMLVRWSPSWTPFIVISWLIVVGLAREGSFLSVSMAMVMAVLLMAVNRFAARRAAAELRWAFVRDSEAASPPANLSR